jgi:DMSO/TMAO reductase YedYZ molybdopterin-dependent catalytic subunit
VERRTVLGWLGNATVLAIGGKVLSACLGVADRKRPSARDADAASADGGPGFEFQPSLGTDPIFDDWYENTVDAQSLIDILAGWTLIVDGMVGKPISIGFADLVALDRQDQTTDFHCVEGWSVYDVPWNGVALARMLDLAGVDAAATHVTFHGIGGQYRESLPIDVAREPRSLLAYGVGGSTLPLAHGFPVRLVVPRLLGYKNAKYLSRIELTDSEVTGYWETYGYSYSGEVPSSRLRPGKY